MVPVIAPFGAGTTATLYAAISQLADGNTSILTLEERVESPIPDGM